MHKSLIQWLVENCFFWFGNTFPSCTSFSLVLEDCNWSDCNFTPLTFAKRQKEIVVELNYKFGIPHSLWDLNPWTKGPWRFWLSQFTYNGHFQGSHFRCGIRRLMDDLSLTWRLSKYSSLGSPHVKPVRNEGASQLISKGLQNLHKTFHFVELKVS